MKNLNREGSQFLPFIHESPPDTILEKWVDIERQKWKKNREEPNLRKKITNHIGNFGEFFSVDDSNSADLFFSGDEPNSNELQSG